jgi:hypothetical protein
MEANSVLEKIAALGKVVDDDVIAPTADQPLGPYLVSCVREFSRRTTRA